MSTPIETMSWLAIQFRDRANEDGSDNVMTDAAQVEAAREAFGDMLAALKALTRSVPHELKASKEFNEAWRAGRDAIARAEGREG